MGKLMLSFFSSEHIFASVVAQQPQQICFTNNTCLVKQCNEPTLCSAGEGCSWGSGAAGRSPNPALDGPGFPQSRSCSARGSSASLTGLLGPCSSLSCLERRPSCYQKKALPASAAACVCPRADCLNENVSSSVLMKWRTIVQVSKTAKLFCCFSSAHPSWCSGTSVKVSPTGVMFPSMEGSGFILLHSEKLQASTSSLKTLLF